MRKWMMWLKLQIRPTKKLWCPFSSKFFWVGRSIFFFTFTYLRNSETSLNKWWLEVTVLFQIGMWKFWNWKGKNLKFWKLWSVFFCKEKNFFQRMSGKSNANCFLTHGQCGSVCGTQLWLLFASIVYFVVAIQRCKFVVGALYSIFFVSWHVTNFLQSMLLATLPTPLWHVWSSLKKSNEFGWNFVNQSSNQSSSTWFIIYYFNWISDNQLSYWFLSSFTICSWMYKQGNRNNVLEWSGFRKGAPYHHRWWYFQGCS